MATVKRLIPVLILAIQMASDLRAQAVQLPQPPKETDQRSTAPEKPEASPGAAPVDPNSYKIGAEDVIGVSVWREPELSRPYTVRPDGKISLFMVKEIDAVGLTPTELEAGVTKAYAAILKNPIVSIQVLRVESKKYYITGEVYRTGAFPLVSPTTILQALTMAGGVREFGNAKKIVIMRGAERIKFNLKDVLKGKNLDTNIFLQPGDHVVVP
jgi:polysaccharide biosynthesis/export protein